MMTLPFSLCWYIFYADTIRSPFFNKGNWVVVGLFAALYTMFCKLYSGFSISTSRISENVYSQTLSALISNGFMYIVISLLSSGFVSVWELLVSLAAQFLLSVVWTWTVHRIYFRKVKPLRTAVIWDMREGVDEFFRSYDLSRRFDVQKSLHMLLKTRKRCSYAAFTALSATRS